MSGADPQSLTPATEQLPALDATISAEHEDRQKPEKVEQRSPVLTKESMLAVHGHAGVSTVDIQSDETPVVLHAPEVTASATEAEAPSEIKLKPSVEVKPPPGRSTGDPSTPLVKKVWLQRVDVIHLH